MKKEKILCIIPARGGSKGIRNKNLQLIAGKTLLRHTVEIAKKSGICAHIIVSTDSADIKKEALSCGALCPFLRPKNLAGDNTPMYPVVRHALNFMENELNVKYDFVLLLQPTSPFRSVSDIKKAFNLLVKSRASSLVSLSKIEDPHPQKAQKVIGGKVYNFITGEKGVRLIRRQDAFPAYRLNGAIYLSRREVLEDSLLAKDVIPYIMPEERSVNIDSKLDLELARCLCRQKAHS